MAMTVQQLAKACGLEVRGGNPESEIVSAANIDQAGPGQVTFVASASYAAGLAGSQASAILVPNSLELPSVPAGTAILPSADPEIDFIRALNLLYPRPPADGGISPGAHVDAGARIGEATVIDAGATVCRGARVGRGCRLYPGSYVGEDCVIGDGCTLHPNVVLYHGSELGNNVTIHAGTVIGADGFGYKTRKGVHIKFPQVGIVRIEDDVEIGANACIDRAALGKTVIGSGSKVDNLVQVAHNVRLGKGVLMCGQAGIGGSTVIEDYVLLVSQSGVADHVRVGRGSKVLAQSGVIGDLPPDSEVVGFPATDRRKAMRETIAVRKLVDLYKPLKALVDLLPKITEKFR